MVDILRRIASGSVGLEIALLQALRQAHYAQCWSRCPENDALWRGYQVRVEVERDDVPELDGIEAHDIRYVDSINLEEELRAALVWHDDGGISIRSKDVLLMKRTQFSHEQEVRLLTEVVEKNVVGRQPDWAIPAFVELFRREYKEGKITKEEFQRRASEVTISRTKTVSIAHVPNFIRSVMLSPFAPREADRWMAQFCTQHSLDYLGKSRMYDFEI